MEIVINGRRVEGEKVQGTDGDYIDGLQVFKLSSNRRVGEPIKHVVSKEELAEIVFEDNSTWIGPLPELQSYLGGELQNRSAVFTIPNSVGLKQSRGIIKNIGLKFLKIFKTKKLKTTTKELAIKIDKSIVPKEGLYFINSDFTLGEPVSKALLENGKKHLLFLHGTVSKYSNSFKDLIENSKVRQDLWNEYSGNLIAFNHHTLSKSPIENAILLAKELPDQITLDIISSSRGGIIADLLSRYNYQNEIIGITEEELEIFDNTDEIIHKESLESLNRILVSNVKSKSFEINKVIRVACPAYGTQILSRKLDIFFNVIRNLIRATSGGSSLLFSTIGNSIIELIKQKDDATVLPGLQAMTPSSIFLGMLNLNTHKVEGELSIVYANSNIKGGFFKGLAFVLSRLIMWTDNDFVVDTKSMSQGVCRNNGLRGLKIHGKDIHHLSYFKHTEFVNSVFSELSGDFQNSRFKETSSLESERGVFGLPGGKYNDEAISYDKDVVIILPGILGSVLSVSTSNESEVIWLDYFMGRKIKRLRVTNDDIKPTHLIASAYENLGKYLRSKNFDVLTFPYDWRLPIAYSGNLLKSFIESKILSNKQLDHDVKFIAHSMGGLVLREYMINHTDSYNELFKRDGFKSIFLGTPWKGSMLILEMLMGQGKRFRSMKWLSLGMRTKKLLKLFSKFDGAIQLLPIDDEDRFDFTNLSRWERLKKEYPSNDWVIPEIDTIESFLSYKKQIQDKAHKLNLSKSVYIAGQSDKTVDNYRIVKYDKGKKSRMEFSTTPRGDSSVTWESGIPEGIKRYYVNVEHGDLASDESLFVGIDEILNTGQASNSIIFRRDEPDTNRKSRDSNSNENQYALKPILSNNKHELIRDILNQGSKITRADEQVLTSLDLKISLGDLSKSDHPVMVARFDDEPLRGAEKAMDRILDEELQLMLDLNLYPKGACTSKVILKDNENSYFKGGIIVGLGSRDKISAYTLESSVTIAALDYVMHECRRRLNKEKIKLGISSVLMGSITGRLTIANSLDAIIKGIAKANEKLIQNNIPATIIKLEIIELFVDRSEDIFITINEIQKSLSETLILNTEKEIDKKEGWSLKMARSYQSGLYNEYSVLYDKKSFKDLPEGIEGLLFRANFGRARDIEIPTAGSGDIIRGLKYKINETSWDGKLSKSLFEYMIPNEFKLEFKRQSNIKLVLDEVTANYPWEMMVTEVENQDPISVNASMIRRFSTATFDSNSNYVTENRAFIIGNPFTDNRYSDLPGARKETDAIVRILKDNNYNIVYPDSKASKLELMTELLSESYKILHIAAHGKYVESYHLENKPEYLQGNNSHNYAKIIIGKKDEDVITSFDLSKLNYVPELVFVNCCHLGVTNIDTKEKDDDFSDRYKIAPSIAKLLIEKGCKAVVVAGWAVDDAAARTFAEEFYRNMFSGMAFGESVKLARRSCYEEHGNTNTWGAYQCYGNPEFHFGKSKSIKPRDNKYLLPSTALIALIDFENNIRFKKIYKKKFADSLAEISNKLRNSPFDLNEELLEKEANCYSQLDLLQEAFDLYSHIKKIGYGSLRVVDQIDTLGMRKAVQNTTSEKEKISQIKKFIQSSKGLLEIASSSKRYARIGHMYQCILSIKWNKDALVNMTSYYKHSFYSLGPNPKYKKYNYPLFMLLKAIYFSQGNLNTINKEIAIKLKLCNEKWQSFANKIENDSRNLGRSTFWDELAQMEFGQLKLLLAKENEIDSKDLSKLKSHFSKAWNFGGTYKQSSASVYHIDFLVNGLEFLKSTKNSKGNDLLDKKIDILIELKRFIQNTSN